MFRHEILRGIDYLMSVQNADGGIPGMRATGTSACWTTAEALEAVLLSPYLRLTFYPHVFKMINFLLNTQITRGPAKGAWPEYISTSNAQTLTTGHAIAALRLSKEIVVDDAEFSQKISHAIEEGLSYLNRVQNPDGGWCIEPGDGNTESRALSTIFVLRGYVTNEFFFGNCSAVRDGCCYLISLLDRDSGGFSKNAGEAPDTCYTARIISILLRAKARTKKDAIIKRALKFIYADKSLKSLFSIKHESYDSVHSAGMVIFHSNTPIDVMEALCLCDEYGKRMRKLGKWIHDSQENNGGWYLGGSPDPAINEGVITWTTNEAVYALSCYNIAFSERYNSALQKRVKLYGSIIITLAIIAVSLLISPVRWPADNWFIAFWTELPALIRKAVLGSVIGVSIVNVLSNLLFDKVKKMLNNGESQ